MRKLANVASYKLVPPEYNTYRSVSGYIQEYVHANTHCLHVNIMYNILSYSVQNTCKNHVQCTRYYRNVGTQGEGMKISEKSQLFMYMYTVYTILSKPWPSGTEDSHNTALYTPDSTVFYYSMTL